jgi:hypothetical protein
MMEIVFSKHAEHRMEKRRVLREEIIEGIIYPDNTLKKHGKYYFQKQLDRGIIEICCEKTERIIKIITVYWL